MNVIWVSRTVGFLSFQDKRSKRTLFNAINNSIFHNFCQSIPENVVSEFPDYNFYYVNNHKNW